MDTARLHYFFHSPLSILPIRDCTDAGGHGAKTEPHIEKNAENWCCECLQLNIRGFKKAPDERYLFLFTTCRNRKMKAYDERRFVVGYIEKGHFLKRNDGTRTWWALQGPTKLYHFRDTFPLERLIGMASAYFVHFKKIDAGQTKTLLKHFGRKRSILSQCVRELGDLKQNGEVRRRCKSSSCE